MNAEITREGDHWLVTRAGAEWRFHTEAGAAGHAEYLNSLPADARPTGWPSGLDLLYEREDRAGR